MPTGRNHRSGTGSAIIVVLLVISLLVVFAFSAAVISRLNLGLTDHFRRSSWALRAAQGGISDAILELLVNDIDWTTGFDHKTLPNGLGDYTMTFNSGQTVLPYSTNNATGIESVTGYNGRRVPPYCVYFISLGRYLGVRGQQAVMAEV